MLRHDVLLLRLYFSSKLLTLALSVLYVVYNLFDIGLEN